MNAYHQAMNQYKNIELQSKIESATPYEVILLLLQGAKSHIAQAKGFIEQNNISAKGQHISKAISIVEGLRSCLNHEEKTKQLSSNLDKVYEIVQHVLLKANIDNDPQLLDKAQNLIEPIYTAWNSIASEVNQ